MDFLALPRFLLILNSEFKISMTLIVMNLILGNSTSVLNHSSELKISRILIVLNLELGMCELNRIKLSFLIYTDLVLNSSSSEFIIIRDLLFWNSKLRINKKRSKVQIQFRNPEI